MIDSGSIRKSEVRLREKTLPSRVKYPRAPGWKRATAKIWPSYGKRTGPSSRVTVLRVLLQFV